MSEEIIDWAKPIYFVDSGVYRDARFLGKINAGTFDHIVAVKNTATSESVVHVSQSGTVSGYPGATITNKIERFGWINIYAGGLLDNKSYDTRELAITNQRKDPGYNLVDTVKLYWRE